MSRAQAIALARGLLPAWVGWVNVLLPVVATLLLSSLSTWSAATIALRLVRDGPSESWVDRARRDFPVRRAMVFCIMLVALLVGSISPFFNGALSPISGGVFDWLMMAPASIGASILVYRRFSRRLGDEPSSASGSGWRSFVVALVVFWPAWLVALIMMTVIGERADARAAATLAGGALTIAFFSFGGGLLILRGLGIAHRPSTRLATIIEATSRRIGVRPRMSFEVRTSIANAFVFPVARILVFTESALAVLDDDEVAAVCAHELGHLAEPQLATILRSLEAYMFLPIGALPLVVVYTGMPGVVAMAVAAFVVSLAFKRFRRAREERADHLAHAHEGEPGIYARALEHLYRANRVPVVLGWKRGSHPELYDRMVAAASAPTYPRPLPPPRLPTLLGVLGGTTVACLALVALVAVRVHVDLQRREEPLWKIALSGEGAPELYQLALARWQEGNHVDAITYYRGAAALAQRSVFYATDLAVALARDGQCKEAALALGDAHARRSPRPLREERRALGTASDAVAECLTTGNR